MKQCVACCRETKEGLNRVGKGYDKLSNLLRELGKFEVLERCVARLQDDDHDVWLHASCRTELWNAHKSLQRAGARNQVLEPPRTSSRKSTSSSESSRSTSGTLLRFKDKCIICPTPMLINFETLRKKNQGNTVRKAVTLEFKRKLIEKGLERADDWGLVTAGRMEGIIDLPAEETYYHLTCYHAFMQGRPPVNEQQKKSGRPTASDKMDVFYETVEFIHNEAFNKTFTLDCVYQKMVELADTRDFYSKKTLRKKLEEEFGETLQFYSPAEGKRDILCFRSDSTQILADYHASASKNDGVDPKKKLLLAAAKILKDEAKCVKSQHTTSSYPPLTDLSQPDPSVPDAYRWFLEALLPPMLAEIWGQCLLREILPRAPVSPFQLANSLYLKHNWNSKKLNEYVWRLGFGVSYKESQNYLWSWLATEMDEGDEESDCEAITQYVADNLDLAMSSSIRVISVHGTASIKVYPEKQGTTTKPLVVHRSVLAQEKREMLEKLQTSLQPYHYSKSKAALGKLNFVAMSSSAENIKHFHEQDLEWLRKDLSEDWCNWSGHQATQVNLEPGYGNNRVSQIEYLPLLNEDPTDYTTLHTLLRNLLKDSGKEPIIVTFDYPLFIKAVEITQSLELPVLVRLGGFHMLKSFLGCIGYIMRGSGLETMVSTVYSGEGTIDHIMRGSAYYKALRTHFLIIKGLFVASGEEEFDRRTLDDMRSRGRTASLWVLYIEMVMLVFWFIRAERLGDVTLHLNATRGMVPFFLAAGHHQYTKGARLALQLFESWKVNYPELINDFFYSGQHTVRYSSRNWSGTWTDMAIEESIMRDAKTSGGLTHGTLRNIDSSLMTWFSFAQCTSSVSSKAERLNYSLGKSRGTPTPYSHPDTKRAARDRDKLAVQKIAELAVEFSPFDPSRNPKELLSLSTGLTDNGGTCNPETAREFGEKFLPQLDDMPYLTTIQRSSKVTNLAALKPSVKIGSTSIRQDQIDPLRLFHRLILIGCRETSIEHCLEFELTPYPMSLFDINGFMRSRNKSAFGALLKNRVETTDSVQLSSSSTVIDGGCLLWEVEWKVGSTYYEFGENSAKKLNKISGTRSVLVLDGYEHSTKDLEHASRQKYSCADQLVDKDKSILVTKNKFFSNGRNKESLIAFLCSWLPTSTSIVDSPITLIIKKSHKDADTLVVKAAIKECQLTDERVIVHGTDTDILILLLFHGHDYPNLYYGRINIRDLWTVLSENERKVFLVAYCFSGVDTVSSIFGKGKAFILNLFSRNDEIRDTIVPAFLEPTTNLERIDDLGVRLIRMIYTQSSDTPLSNVRHKTYIKQCFSGKIKPERLPPTEGAAVQHCRRAFQQCREWVLLNTDLAAGPFGWEWDTSRNMFIPVYSQSPMAPSELETFVSCGCEGSCSKNTCSCFKNSVRCIASVCKNCTPEGKCENFEQDVTDVVDEEEESEEES